MVEVGCTINRTCDFLGKKIVDFGFVKEMVKNQQTKFHQKIQQKKVPWSLMS